MHSIVSKGLTAVRFRRTVESDKADVRVFGRARIDAVLVVRFLAVSVVISLAVLDPTAHAGIGSAVIKVGNLVGETNDAKLGLVVVD